jgi:hypothetical protein
MMRTARERRASCDPVLTPPPARRNREALCLYRTDEEPEGSLAGSFGI